MIYKIKYDKDALKFIKKNKQMGHKFQIAFIEITTDIKNNFIKYDIKKLKNISNTYRLRISKYRAIFRIVNDQLLILILDIDNRGDIYKSHLCQ